MEYNNIEDSYPLSPMQQGMLFHTLYAPRSGVYIQQMLVSMREDLNVPAFKEAWQQIMKRHAVLRTSFRWEDLAAPLQDVHRQVQLPFNYYDWRNLSSEEQENRLQAYLQSDRNRGFELTEPPLMRLTLFQMAGAGYKLVWTSHHALFDGRSRLLLLKELFAFYEAFCRNQDLEPVVPRPYRDYIEWLQQHDLSKREVFWRKKLENFTAPTPLIVDQSPASGPPGYESPRGEQKIQLSKEVTATLQLLARQNELTLNTFIQGAWALLLSRYSGEEDVTFGTIRACRRSTIAEAGSIVGLFINTLPIRVKIPPLMPLLPWLKELREQHIVLREYEHTPLTKIQEWSDMTGGSPLFESIVDFEKYDLNIALKEQGQNWQNRDFQLLQKTNYPLTIEGRGGESLLLRISYDRQRFDEATISRMLGHLKTLLDSISANLEKPISQLPLLTEVERHQLLVTWNNTKADYPQDRCIHQLFEAQVKQTPDALAISHRDRQLTYRELNARANQLARYLQKYGVGPDVLVGICMDRSLEMMIGLLGILKAGGTYLPLDPTYPKARLAFMLADAQVSMLLTRARLVTKLPEHKAQLILVDSDWAAIADENEENLTGEAMPQNLAYVIYTSGSTGKPKGVEVQHQALVNHSFGVIKCYDLRPSDRILHFSSISFDVAAEELFPTWLVGATVVLHPNQEFASFTDFLHFVEQQGLTVLNLPTPYWHEWISELASSGAQLPAALRIVIVGSEQVLQKQFADWNKIAGADISWYNAYGTTETTITSTIYKPGRPQGHHNTYTTPIGRPIANTQIYLLDSHRQLVPVGVPGELYIGGDGLARGYLNQAELTAEKFIPNPYSRKPGARLYKTGDLARYLPDGNIEFLGRIDHQVKIRGFRIELGEIETALREHPAIQESVLTVYESAPGNKRLAAYIVSGDEQAPAAGELRRFLEQKLPEYMIPFTFISLDALPLTPNGKVDRRTLPAPDKFRTASPKTFVPPQTPTEKTLAGIWAEILGLERVGVHDNFFELGGHSLLATQVIYRLRRAFQLNLSLRSLFEAPTVAGLAESIETIRWATQSQPPADTAANDRNYGEL